MDARESAVLTLGLYFSLYGYVRRPKRERLRDDGWSVYKKGWEVRFRTRREDVDFVRAVISRAGYEPKKPFLKRKRLIQPVYGADAVQEITAAAGRPSPFRPS